MIMKKLLLSISTVFLVLFTGFELANAQERSGDSPRVSPNAAVSQTIGTTIVEIKYGRPGARDRQVFGQLVPFQQVWRTGADESTAISFSDDVIFGGERVAAGVYSLYTIPGEDLWTIIINERHSWGTQYDESYDVIRIDAQPEDASHMEQFMIYFRNIDADQGELVLHWENTRVPVTISVNN
jgi:hypothetical protein